MCLCILRDLILSMLTHLKVNPIWRLLDPNVLEQIVWLLHHSTKIIMNGAIFSVQLHLCNGIRRTIYIKNCMPSFQRMLSRKKIINYADMASYTNDNTHSLLIHMEFESNCHCLQKSIFCFLICMSLSVLYRLLLF